MPTNPSAWAVRIPVMTLALFSLAACGPKYVGDPTNVVCARAGATQNEMARQFNMIVDRQHAPVASLFNWVDPSAIGFDWTGRASSEAKTEFVEALLATDLFVGLSKSQDGCSA